MDNEIFEVYHSDTNGKRINKPIVSKARTYQNIRDFTECVTANIYKPMDWKLFLKLNDSTKKLYISHLRTTYNATDVQLGKMFGVDNSTVSRKCRELHIPKTKGKRSFEQSKAWNDFLYGIELKAKNEIPIANEDTVTKELPKEISNTKEDISKMSMSNLHIEFSGRLDARFIAEKLVALWGSDRDCKVVIDIE